MQSSTNKKIIKVPANFEPRDYQLKLFQAMDGIIGRPETRMLRAFCRWHRRAGKDLCGWAYLIKEAVRRKGIYYYFLPTYSQGRKIIWEGITKEGIKFLELIPEELLDGKPRDQDMLIRLTNGSIIRVIGTDNIDSIMGTNPIGCVFSEYAIQDPQAWAFIRPILSENGGWAIFNGTPRGRNHMYKLDLKVRHRDDWYCSTLQTLWPDKPNYTGIVGVEQINKEREEGMDEDLMEQEFGVSYSAGVKGAFYADHIQRARDSGRIGVFLPDQHKWVDTFWDLGVDDSTAVWFRQIDGNRLIFIDYFEDSNKDIAYYVKMLRDKGYEYRTHYLPWDGDHRSIQSQYTTRELLSLCCESAGVSNDIVTVPKIPIQDGINAVRARFSKYYFNEPMCDEGIQKLELYHRRFDSKREVYLKEPVHDWTSHCADALRTEALAEDFYEDEFFNNNNIVVKKIEEDPLD